MPATFCAMPGCAVVLTRGVRCPVHNVLREQARPNVDTRRWYRTARWRALRLQVLREAGYACAGCGLVLVALEVDHIRKAAGVPAIFWDRANLQALCKTCHARKTREGQ